MYGDPQVHPQPETYWGNVNPIGPRGVYDEAKRYAEALTMTYHAQQGVDTCIARIFNTYGPRMRRNDGRASVNFLNQALEGKPLTVYGDGSQTRSLCYVDDLIRGIYLLATSDEHLPVNIGNPDHEVTMLELAQTVIRVTGSTSEVVFEALPTDDPQVRRPDITRARQVLGWAPGDRSRGRAPPLGEGARPGAGDRLGMRWAGVIVAVCLTAFVAATARPAEGSRYLRVGIYDEAQTLYGPVDKTFALFKQLHAQEVRLNLYWGGKYGVATSRPRSATNPADPAYDWSLYDRTVQYAAQSGVHVLFSVYGTPAWANGGKGMNVAPTRAVDLRNFALAAAKRYSGTYKGTDGADPAGGEGVARLERAEQPDLPRAAVPQVRDRLGDPERERPTRGSATRSTTACTRRWRRASGSRAAARRPRGNNNPSSSRPSVSPLAFLRAAKLAGLKTFDAWAHHPYYAGPSDTPTSKPVTTKGAPATAVTLGNLSDLIREVTRLYGNKRIWITEYGYQTNPPDPIFGVSWAKQAAYLTEAFGIARRNPRIDMMLWFLLKDEPNLSGWQSGLITYSGVKKPSFAAFMKMAAVLNPGP